MKTALLVIDVQKEYAKGGALEIPGIEGTLAKIASLLAAARKRGTEIIHIRHVSADADAEDFAPGSDGVGFIDGFSPERGEKNITKHYPGSFWKTSLNRHLRAKGVEAIAICGFSSFLCCDTTAREAFQHGYRVYFVEDAIGEFPIGGLPLRAIHNYACTVQGEAGFSQITTVRKMAPLL